MTDTLNDSEFRRYALLGAEARLMQINKEAASIYQAFPELRKQGGGRPAQSRAEDGAAPASRGRRRGRMSAAQREAVRERMKRYWAQRKGASASTDGAAAASEAAVAGGSARAKTARGSRGPRKMSAAARKRISDAQKARWAKRKRAGA
jgi:hypothetical protein